MLHQLLWQQTAWSLLSNTLLLVVSDINPAYRRWLTVVKYVMMTLCNNIVTMLVWRYGTFWWSQNWRNKHEWFEINHDKQIKHTHPTSTYIHTHTHTSIDMLHICIILNIYSNISRHMFTIIRKINVYSI